MPNFINFPLETNKIFLINSLSEKSSHSKKTNPTPNFHVRLPNQFLQSKPAQDSPSESFRSPYLSLRLQHLPAFLQPLQRQRGDAAHCQKDPNFSPKPSQYPQDQGNYQWTGLQNSLPPDFRGR